MTVLASIANSPSVDFPLFLHVLGAMVLVGGLLAGASSLGFARGDVKFLRLGYWSLLAVSLPGWILMRIGAEWILSRENIPSDNEPGWVGTGYLTADLGGILILLATILTWLGLRRLRSGGGGGGLAKTGTVLATLVVALYVIAIWAMTTKPT